MFMTNPNPRPRLGTPENPLRGRELYDAVMWQVQQYPETHDQSWVMEGSSRLEPSSEAVCGSTGCLAGWAIYWGIGGLYDSTRQQAVNNKVIQAGGDCQAAAALLGVDREEFEVRVFLNMSTKQAIKNLTQLIDETYPVNA